MIKLIKKIKNRRLFKHGWIAIDTLPHNVFGLSGERMCRTDKGIVIFGKLHWYRVEEDWCCFGNDGDILSGIRHFKERPNL